MAPAGEDRPLPSEDAPGEKAEEAEEEELETEIDREDARPRPSSPGFKFSTFLYTFLFLLGILMVFDTGTRDGVALALDRLLSPLLGFGGAYPLLTMLAAAVVEMLLTAVAYNYTTDWVKAARVQKWSAALRKVQLAAMRSGKKDRIAALQTHQQTLARLSTEVSFAQLKGMAITWFLVIAIYTWVYLFLYGKTQIYALPSRLAVHVGSASIGLTDPLLGPISTWFLVFTVYTVPLSLVFRRLLKHYSLRRQAATLDAPASPPSGHVGGPA